MSAIIFKTQELCWNPLILMWFMGTGLYFTVRSGFLQIRHPIKIFRATFGNMKKNDCRDGISPYAALSAALAACMGTGNIIGVASALSLGGPGAVLWMIISAILGEMTAFAENTLGIIHREKNEKNEWTGGSINYIEKALGKKGSVLFCIFCIGASLGMGNMTQVNTIAVTLNEQTNAVPLAVGFAVAAVVGMVIIGGVNRISKVTEKIIPPLSAVVIFALIAVTLKNYNQIIPSIKLIFESAFGFRSAAAGISGYTVGKAIKLGIARGVFSNEAGLGSSPIVHSAADVDSPARQGLWGITEVFIDTVLMCTLTALALLTSGNATNPALSPVEMCVNTFADIFGNYAGIFVCISLCLFAFATVTGWSYYGEKAAEYVFGEKHTWLYRCIYLICIVTGACIQLDTVWALSDIFNALMAIPNLAAIWKLKKAIIPYIKMAAQL